MAATTSLPMEQVYVPGAGRYRTDVGCQELVEVCGGLRPCGSNVINAITRLCDARGEHADTAAIARMRDDETTSFHVDGEFVG